MIGARIKQARTAAGLSLRDLGDRVGLSAMALSKYERDEIKPSSDVLLRLGKALDVRVEYFFRTREVALEGVEFRKHSKLSTKDEQRVLADVREQMERWLDLEEVIPSATLPFNPPVKLPELINSYDEIEAFASAVREDWQLGVNPIPNLIEELELEGIRVIVTPHDGDQAFDGLCALTNGQPVVVVGKSVPGDRQRFTLSHELAHLLLEGRLAPTLNLEAACNRFAGAFLVPGDQVKRALGESRSWIEPRELYLLKKDWGLSMGGWLHRAAELNIISKDVEAKLWSVFRAHGWKDKEPGQQYPQECTERYSQLVYRALAEEFIGESRAAEMLGLKIREFKRQRGMEQPDEADCH